MSDYRLNGLLWALGLVATGVILLLFNFGVLTQFEPLAQYVLSGLFALGGIGFFTGYATSRANWWRLIPAWTLLALAGMVFLSTMPELDSRLIAALLFVGLALAFAHIYLLDRADRWWAIIPGGFMLVLSLVIALSGFVEQIETLGTILFVGMGAVFFVLYLLAGHRRQWWALIPGSVLTLFGFFIFTLDQDESNLVWRLWPLALIALGVLFGWRNARRPAPRRMDTNTAPKSAAQVAPISAGRLPTTAENQKSPASLGEYSRPAPGASVEVLPDPDDG